ncbi:TolC family protein [Hydrogenimonas thermophila]|uniref:Outer membrane protein TolC n=1 Tax=Hydrogenimonas thermophila TaxID=223786 RepID=A0A1I5N9P1_9BACT|nr:TolC family protein [Hydrogenimonas thermophila]SFP18417.1 Outer membrane protein TolC [Hydrogenimonas thermophila]
MKRLTLLLFPLLIYAQTYQEILSGVDNSLQLKSAKQLEESAKLISEAKRGKNLPTLDLSLSGVWLNEKPTVNFVNTTFPLGSERSFTGSLKLSYPIFTGFAISAEIDQAKLEYEKASLKVLDLKRNLYLQATQLFGAIYAAQETLNAKQDAKKAIEDAYKKAKGLYDNGILPPADLYNIEAKRYAIEAEITDAKSQKDRLLNQLKYLLNQPITSVEFSNYPLQKLNKKEIITTALQNREDIQALQRTLKIDKENEKLAKSRYYPTIALTAELKRKGDTLALNGDGFSNADQSYIGTVISWNLFNGFSDKKQYEASCYRTLSAKTALNDYKNSVKTELENAFLTLSALQSKLLSAKMELKAQKEYYKLTKGRFENQLASADELSRAIADLSVAHAKVSVLKSQIFIQTATIGLMAGLERFKTLFIK